MKSQKANRCNSLFFQLPYNLGIDTQVGSRCFQDLITCTPLPAGSRKVATISSYIALEKLQNMSCFACGLGCVQSKSQGQKVYVHLVQNSWVVFVYQVSLQRRERVFTEVSDNNLVYWTWFLKHLQIPIVVLVKEKDRYINQTCTKYLNINLTLLLNMCCFTVASILPIFFPSVGIFRKLGSDENKVAELENLHFKSVSYSCRCFRYILKCFKNVQGSEVRRGINSGKS